MESHSFQPGLPSIIIGYEMSLVCLIANDCYGPGEGTTQSVMSLISCIPESQKWERQCFCNFFSGKFLRKIPHATLSSWDWKKVIKMKLVIPLENIVHLSAVCFYHPDFLLYPSVSKPYFICPSQGQCWSYSVHLSYS